MSPRIRELVNDITAALLFGLALALAVPQAYAGVISPEDDERGRVKSMLERPELAAGGQSGTRDALLVILVVLLVLLLI